MQKHERYCAGTAEKGFTLIELLVIVGILALLVSLVAPRFVNRMGSAKTKTAKAQIELFSTAIDTFRLDMGRYPTSLDELVEQLDDKRWEGPYLPKKIPRDPWGNDYEYKSPGDGGRDYDIISYGRDGTSGGSDEDADVCSWKNPGDDDDEDED